MFRISRERNRERCCNASMGDGSDLVVSERN